ncbi:hypothetical protein SLEP1_g6624 [Rubroshorea leprosula]|uniref:Uncharacterized protein n=1 Tax=Rubroshorea leprosula TaxID=152421 RepID=A0AAV5I5S1_9ROSI|nr:hypothetical protein SLEP1_g6624 [Rubroshorea leprosula]
MSWVAGFDETQICWVLSNPALLVTRTQPCWSREPSLVGRVNPALLVAQTQPCWVGRNPAARFTQLARLGFDQPMLDETSKAATCFSSFSPRQAPHSHRRTPLEKVGKA